MAMRFLLASLCLQWRQKIFPIPREGLTAELLDEDVRFRRLREDGDGCPVPCLSAVQFALGSISAQSERGRVEDRIFASRARKANAVGQCRVRKVVNLATYAT